MKKIFIILLVLIALPLVIPAPGQAIPAFARKYGFNCMMCHTAYPKLNDWGQRYRDNGYQLPGQVGQGKDGVRYAIRPSRSGPRPASTATARSRTRTRTIGRREASGSGGSIFSPRASSTRTSPCSSIYTPRIDEPFADYTGAGASQPGALESASIIFSNIIPERPERAGRTLRAGLSSLQLEALLLSPVAVRRLRIPDGRQRLPLRRQPDRVRGDGAFQDGIQVRPRASSTARARSPTTTSSRTSI